MRSFVLFFVNVLGTVIQLKDNDWKKIATFECRGIEFVEFLPEHGFSALSSVSETVFGEAGGEEPIDLTEGDWAGYDEEADESVGIYEFQARFVTSSKK